MRQTRTLGTVGWRWADIDRARMPLVAVEKAVSRTLGVLYRLATEAPCAPPGAHPAPSCDRGPVRISGRPAVNQPCRPGCPVRFACDRAVPYAPSNALRPGAPPPTRHAAGPRGPRRPPARRRAEPTRPGPAPTATWPRCRDPPAPCFRVAPPSAASARPAAHVAPPPHTRAARPPLVVPCPPSTGPPSRTCSLKTHEHMFDS